MAMCECGIEALRSDLALLRNVETENQADCWPTRVKPKNGSSFRPISGRCSIPTKPSKDSAVSGGPPRNRVDFLTVSS